MAYYSNSAPFRLRIYLKQNRNFQVFIGYPLANPIEWIQIFNFNNTELICGKRRIYINDVRSFIIAYPSGEILDGELVFYPLPQGIYYIQNEKNIKSEIIIPENLKLGNQLLKIVHEKAVHEKRNNYYSTKLINISPEKIRVIKFAGYTQYHGMYILSTITGGYFSEQNFREWYGVDEDGWIKLGQIVIDPNNYSGGKSYWVYFCVNESGKEFIAGAQFQEVSHWWKLW
ncbi:hypothetical protein [uncultured Nostoc sp.]|uniref:hypothetical protein n=1 Tax=uncultured Nostoc sp. TaxID=340711 RepID=UPI002605A550|nr:hypothetical protein [uncultured Nostoc sp.]